MIYIKGDIHGQQNEIKKFCEEYNPNEGDILVLLGDVGANYQRLFRDRRFKYDISRYPIIYFCVHGNHECRPQNIASYSEKEWNGGRVMYEEEFPNILFPVDGDIFTLGEKRCIAIGGAYSVDKYSKIQQKLWWPDEQPTPTIKEYVEQQLAENEVDIIFSHTCPYKYEPTEMFLEGIDRSKVDSSTEEWLDRIEESTDYKAWYCGHWHTDKRVDKLHFLFKETEILDGT